MLSAFITIAVSLFFVLNALGNLAIFIGLLKSFSKKEQTIIILREFSIALGIMLLFAFFGESVLRFLGVSKQVVGIAGGFLLILIAVSMIFPKTEGGGADITWTHEPIVVPLAIPVLAGPGTITAVMVFSQNFNPFFVSLASLVVIVVSLAIVLIACSFKKVFGEKGLIAIERLGGFIISLIGVEMITRGIIDLVKINFP